MDELLSIGRFGRLAGLSIGALRHYDTQGLLAPAWVDPQTGYRFYRAAQADSARLIGRLRELGLGLPDVRAVVGADADGRHRLLAAHRSRLEAQLAQLQRAIHQINRFVEHEDPLMTTPAKSLDVDHRRLGVDLFNHVWTLLEKADRDAAETDEMIHAAHASRYHWSRADAGPEHMARGEWQCSRVYAVLGRGEPALWHARRCLEICEANGIGDWDLAFAYEALARAWRVAGDRDQAAQFVARAAEAGERIADPEDRELLRGDLATIDA